MKLVFAAFFAVIIAVVLLQPCLAQEKSAREKALKLCSEGEALISLGKIEQALACFEEALDVDIKCIEAHKRYQDILLAMDERDKLLGNYREFVQIMPNSALFNFLYARLHADDLDIEQKYLKKAVNLDGKFYEARFALGLSFLSGKQYKESLEQLAKCAEFRPDDHMVKFRIADVHLKLGDYDKARECYREVEKAVPGNPVVQYALGCSYAYQGNHKEAVKYFEKAGKLGFSDKGFIVDWAQSCLGIGDRKAALKVYERLFESDAVREDFAQIEQLILSMCEPFADLGPAQKEQLSKAVGLLEGEPAKPAEARAILEKLATDAGGSEAVHHMLGRALLASGEKEKAATAFEKAVELNEFYPAPLVYLGLIEYASRKPKEAREKFLKALSLDPFNAQANTYAAILLANMDENKDALKYAKRSYQITGSLRDVGDVLVFAELKLEDDSLLEREFEAGPWKVKVYRGMEQIDPKRAYAYRFLAYRDGKRDRAIVVNSRLVRDIDGPDPDAFAMYHFLEETRRVGRGVRDFRYDSYGKALPQLDKIVEKVKEELLKNFKEEQQEKVDQEDKGDK